MLFHQILQQVRDDNTHGANELASLTMDNMAQALIDEPSISKQAWLKLTADLSRCRPSMVPLNNLMKIIRVEFSKLQEFAFAEKALPVLQSVHNRFCQATQSVARYAVTLLRDGITVMTLSRSSAVTTTFRFARDQGLRIQVILLASGPGNEGYLVATELDQLEVPVTLIPDAQMALFINQADIVLVGCDSWLCDGSFVNKSGTCPLLTVAAYHHKPVWVLADSYKNSDQSSATVELEEMDPARLDTPSGNYITSRNIWFETIPLSLVTGRVDEHGCRLTSEGNSQHGTG